MIRLPHGGKNAQFDEQDLIAHMVKSGRDYTIQGQQNCSFANRTKPNSLDYWLRVNYAVTPDTKRAVNEVAEQLAEAGLSEMVHNLRRLDSWNLCIGLRLNR